MKRSVFVAVVILALSGCLHRSPEDRILAAFGEASDDWTFFVGPQPQFLRYGDKASARIFGSLTRSGQYRIAPESEPLLCPGVAEPGNHGYALGVRVNSVMGDSAIATISGACSRFVARCPAGETCLSIGDAMKYQTEYLLRRTREGWRVEKALAGSIAIMG